MAARALPDIRYRVTSIVGTRPEAIKMAPVIKALALLPSIEQRICLTGQHGDLAEHFDFLPGGVVALAADCRNLSVKRLRDQLTAAIDAHLRAAPADLVLVQGDTTSALAGALVAHRLGIAIGHVEAGLRSFDRRQPWPEEDNRVAIDALSDLLFAPTETAKRNLLAEPTVSGGIHVTGNTGIDALFEIRKSLPPAKRCKESRNIVVTCHRKENSNEALAAICDALKRIVGTLPVNIIFPVHPNRHLRARLRAMLSGQPGISLIDPLPYPRMVALMDDAWLILSDSGGIQEEAPALGVPLLVLRNRTERPEAGEACALVGTDPDRIVAKVHQLFHDELLHARMARPSLPFGDGHAGPHIAALVEDWLVGQRLRAAS